MPIDNIKYQTQRNRPRPFYCTQYSDNYNNSGITTDSKSNFQTSRDGYQFQTLPDVVQLDAPFVYNGHDFSDFGWQWGIEQQ